jgi:hypothetical protein
VEDPILQVVYLLVEAAVGVAVVSAILMDPLLEGGVELVAVAGAV